MKIWTRIWLCLLAGSWAFTCGAVSANQTVDSAIQAIQQAPDPSAAVTAYANGFALDRNNPRLYDAYVARMVDLGLPEMAYHQAQTLTTLQANNGLAWGVVAYVEARRAQMPEALSAINLAGQYAPDNKFVQHTAGELAAWYDLKADKATIPENTKDGLTKARKLLEQRPAYTEAYATAQKAYQTGTTPQVNPTAPAAPAAAPQPAPSSAVPNAEAPSPMVPNAPQVPMAPQVPADQGAPYSYAPPAPLYSPNYYGPYYSPDYYAGAYLDWGPSYGYAWGPGWVAPSPWWWWQPCGFWGGFSFFPFGTVFVFDFDHHDHHGHDGHGHDGHSHHGDQFAHNTATGHGHDPASWHNGSQGQKSFFGTPARPSDSTMHWARATATAQSASTRNTFAPAANAHTWSSTSQRSAFATTGSSARSAQSSAFAHNPTISTPQTHSWSGSSSMMRGPATTPNSWANHGYTTRSYVAPRTSWSAPSYRAPTYSAPRYSAPSQSFSGGFNGWHGSSGMSAAPHSFGAPAGGFQGGSSFSGGFHGGAPMGGGGFHGGGGAMGGGGHGGGGHR
jgi:hypothetical protein